jgi:hypothetical protein
MPETIPKGQSDVPNACRKTEEAHQKAILELALRALRQTQTDHDNRWRCKVAPRLLHSHSARQTG